MMKILYLLSSWFVKIKSRGKVFLSDFCFLFLFLETESHCVAQTGPKFTENYLGSTTPSEIYLFIYSFICYVYLVCWVDGGSSAPECRNL